MTMKRTALLLLTLCALLALVSCEKESEQPSGTLEATNDAVDFYFYYPDTWQVYLDTGMIAVKPTPSSSGIVGTSISVSAFELDGEDAKRLLANGVKVVAEVSNMGCRPEAIDAFIAAKIPYGPGKAVNAGGVATSGLEMTQNAQKLNWTAEEVDAKLHQIMSSIHHACLEYGTEKDGYINYMKGANIAGFMKVAKSMVEQGVL